VKIDILFSIMTLREIEFFSKTIPRLKERGYPNVGFITFHEAGDRILKKAQVPFFSMHKLTEKENLSKCGYELSKELESAYGIPSIRNMFLHDRFTLNRSNEVALLKKSARYLAVLNKIFKENQICCVVQELGGFIANQAVYYAAKRVGIRNVFIEPSMYPGRVLFTDSLFAKIPVDQTFSENAKRESQIAWDKYLSTAPVNIPDKDVHHFADMGISKLLATDNWCKLGRKIFHKYITHDREEYNAIGFTVVSNIKKLLRRRILNGIYKQPVIGEKYVYYPLHVPNDFQLFVRSPEFTNQEALIEYIGRCLPYGYKLYVKEHPAAIGAHALGSTRHYLKARNTKLIHPCVNSSDLIGNAACVVTVNSKVGVEALMRLKPVVVLGKAFYRGHGITHDVQILGGLSSVIKQAIGRPPDHGQVSDFLARVYAGTYPGELYAQAEEKAHEFASSLGNFIQLS